ncbi:MAG: RluA family pseudouridine synthase [Candidatus Omnitrophota bacterium]
MEKFTFEVSEREPSIRLDQYLVSVFPKPISRSHIKRLIDNGNILVNGVRVKVHHRVKPGEKIEVALEELPLSGLEPEDIPLNIIYEDDDIIVVNKPPGIASHPGPGITSGTLVNALLHHCKTLSAVDEARPGIVHRLDKDTSGIMVIAKNNFSHAELAKQFKERTIKKRYIALVKGVVELDEGVVDLPIGRHPRLRQKMAVRYDSPKKAVTEYKVLKRFKDFTMVELNLKTGRTHQIRVHMAYLGHPILGDEKYGAKGKFNRQALHSYALSFRHPRTGANLEFVAELPNDIKRLIG